MTTTCNNNFWTKVYDRLLENEQKLSHLSVQRLFIIEISLKLFLFWLRF